MSDHLRERDVPETTGPDETERLVDRVRDGHFFLSPGGKVTTIRGALRA
jgi:hypothetical protein